MLSRPSARRRSKNAQITLNLVPILDTMVTLIGFLLFTSSFLSLVTIESMLPQVSAQVVQEKLKEKPLQLTVTLKQNEVEIWSPFDRVSAKHLPNAEPGKPDLKSIHETLLTIKQQFPQETKIVIVPHAGVNYDTLIATMDSLRNLDPTDPPIYTRNPQTGTDEVVKGLFPEVVFGNLLGGAGESG